MCCFLSEGWVHYCAIEARYDVPIWALALWLCMLHNDLWYHSSSQLIPRFLLEKLPQVHISLKAPRLIARSFRPWLYQGEQYICVIMIGPFSDRSSWTSLFQQPDSCGYSRCSLDSIFCWGTSDIQTLQASTWHFLLGLAWHDSELHCRRPYKDSDHRPTG